MININLTFPLPKKAVFVRISDEYAANFLRTSLFTVIVGYIFNSCREYPANKVGLTIKVIAEWFAACHIIAAYSQQKL